MPEYLSPGVYVEEVSGGAKPIEAVGTSTACFIGFTERVPKPKVKDPKNPDKTQAGQPIFVTSWEEYVSQFGSFVPNYYTPLSVYAFFQNGGKRCYVVSLRAIPRASVDLLSEKMLTANDTKPFLKLEAKVPGEKGENLRYSIRRVKDRMPTTNPPKFKLIVSEEGSATHKADWQTKETHTITLTEGANNTITVTQSDPKAQDVVTIATIPSFQSDAPLENITKSLKKAQEQGLSWKSIDLSIAGVRTPLVEIKPKDVNTDVSGYQLKVSEAKKDGNSCSFTVEVQLKSTSATGAEELEFTLERVKQGTDEVISLRPLSKGSSTVEVFEQNPTALPNWSRIYDLWPAKDQEIKLTENEKQVSIPGVKDKFGFLGVRSTKEGSDFRNLTLKIETVPPSKIDDPNPFDKPEFRLAIERKVKDSWRPVEERAISLRREIKRKEFEADKPEETRKVLSVEYLNGQVPTFVDVLPCQPDVDISALELMDLWPLEQNATMPLKIKELQKPQLEIRPDVATNESRDDLLGKARYEQYVGDAMERTGMGGLAEIDDINFICMPDLMKAWDDTKPETQKYVKSIQSLAIAHCDTLRNRVVILDPPPNMNPQEIKQWRQDLAGYDSSRAMLYYPWVEAMDPVADETIFMPPSGFVAGIWARNDNLRGVHKAPANEVVQLAVGLQFDVGQGHQDILNPNGVNCIRQLRGMGIRVWGARTLSQSDPEWKYINVRRLFHMIEQSIQRNTMWAVFEPNDQRLWAKLRRDVSNFLMLLYSQGMLFGATASQAFFVKCDETNNPKYVRDAGQVIIDIGVAPVKPAEFVIFRIRQWSPEDDQA